MSGPPLAVTFPDGSRKYVHPLTGEQVPSVTSVLKIIANPRLRNWRVNTAARYARENWEDLAQLAAWERESLIAGAPDAAAGARAEVGTAVHEAAEAWAKGVPAPELPKSIGSYMNQFAGFLMECNPEILESEATVWSREHRYAGTFDLLVRIKGVTWLLDTKTSKRPYPEHGLQLAALANADFLIREDGTEEELPGITHQAVLHLRPRSWKLVKIAREDENWECFKAARRIWGWLETTSVDVLVA